MLDNGSLKAQTQNQKKIAKKKGIVMRGDIISAEYIKMVFVRDDSGGEFACYATDLSDRNHVKENEKDNCIDTNLILGASW